MTPNEINPDTKTVMLIKHKIAGILMNMASGGRLLSISKIDPILLSERIKEDTNAIRQALDEVESRSTDLIPELTDEQWETFESLVRLGDSKNLALKTVMGMKKIDPTPYIKAYHQ